MQIEELPNTLRGFDSRDPNVSLHLCTLRVTSWTSPRIHSLAVHVRPLQLSLPGGRRRTPGRIGRHPQRRGGRRHFQPPWVHGIGVQLRHYPCPGLAQNWGGGGGWFDDSQSLGLSSLREAQNRLQWPFPNNNHVPIWVWLKVKQEGQTAGFGPCFHWGKPCWYRSF